MAEVWDHSKASDSKLIILLAIADFANEEGIAWPGVKTLAKKARLGLRETQYVLRQLEASGELRTLIKAGPKKCNLYQVMVQPIAPCSALHHAAECTPMVQPIAPSMVQPIAPKPSVEPSIEPSKRRARASAHAHAGNSSFKPEDVSLPFASDQFHAAWLEWCKHRKEIRKPLTEASVRGQLRDCQKWGEERAIVALEKSVSSSWQGLFEPKDAISKNNTHREHDQPFRGHI